MNIRYIASSIRDSIHLSLHLREINIRNCVEGGVLIAVCRNEFNKVPFFLDFYRKMGFENFIIIDNCSTDGTTEYLENQPDVTLYSLDFGFFDSLKIKIVNYVANKHANKSWILHVDIDELICHPILLKEGIRGFLSRLDKYGVRSVWTPMIDMYPNSLNEQYFAGDSFIDHSAYYDSISTYSLTEKSYRYDLRGGVRARMFYFDEMEISPQCSKTSLIKFGGQLRFAGEHHTSLHEATKANVVAPLLHFKFIGNFKVKVRQLVEENQHWNNSSEYKAYLRGMVGWEQEQTLSCSTTKKITNFESFTEEFHEFSEMVLQKKFIRITN